MKTSTLAFLAASGTLSAASSSKKGLIYIPNAETPEDDALWIQDGSILSWYYTYTPNPTPAYNGKFEFVPMMWGMGENPDDTRFLEGITSQLDAGANITHVLAFNEPDLRNDWGGSDLDPARAARGYVANFIPLRQRGMKVGLPAVSGAGWGIQWLRDFRDNCTQLLDADCEYDFLPVHWYDSFGGLQAHIDEALGEFPDVRIWVTEYAYAHRNLDETQEFYQQSEEYLDNHENVDRYSYFGAFRSDVSNVGPNATFLNADGQLTDIGMWYLGLVGSGVDP